MGVYQMNEAIFEVPRQWEDRSVNVFSYQGPVPGNFAFVITRDLMEENQSEDTYIESQLAQLAKTLPQFRLLAQREVTVDHSFGLETEFTWISNGLLMIQRQTYLFRGTGVIILTATASNRFTDENEYDLRIMMKSFRFTDERY